VQAGRLLAALLMLLGPAAAPARSVVDATGAAIEIPEVPQRVIALAPDLTEVAFALGSGSRLVGACDACDQPAAAAALPDVGSMVQPSIEAIVLLHPDLVLATSEGNPRAVLERLRALGIPAFGVQPGPGLDGVAATVGTLGDLLGAGDEAQRLVADMRRRIAATREAAAKRPRVRACALAWTDPLIAAGRGTYLGDLLDVVNAENACASADGWPRISRESLVLAAPQVLLLATGQEDAEARAGLEGWAQAVPAVRDGAVLVLPAHPFLRPTTALGEGAESLLSMMDRVPPRAATPAR
jgi:iron complex transport system substrate-binding protein